MSEEFERDALNNVTGNKDVKDGELFAITSPRTKEEYEFPISILTGQDWTGRIDSSDGTFSPEELKNFHEFAVKGPSSAYKDLTDLGSEIKDFWIQEIWDKVNPGLTLLSHSIKTDESSSFNVNAWAGGQYTVVVYLTPDMSPIDGGSLELWTPNLTDKMKAMAINTPYTFDMTDEYSFEIFKSYWPKPGRTVVFDSRIPNIARPVEGNKSRVSLVFKGTSEGYVEPTGDELESDGTLTYNPSTGPSTGKVTATGFGVDFSEVE